MTVGHRHGGGLPCSNGGDWRSICPLACSLTFCGPKDVSVEEEKADDTHDPHSEPAIEHHPAKSLCKRLVDIAAG